MRRVALLVAVAVLAGCGGGKHTPSARDRVTAYIGRVNLVQAEMRKPLLQVQLAVTGFGRGADRAKTVADMTRADATLRRLRRRLDATDPPPQARRLHRLTLQLVDEETSLASELRDVAVFDPRFAAAMRPLAQAHASTQAALKGVHRVQEVAASVRTYRAAVEGSLSALRALRPPAVERPLYLAQVARLVALDESLGRLLQAVQKRKANAIAVAEHDVAVASVSSDSTANQRAEQAAIRAFDQRVVAANKLVQRIAEERTRLQTTLH